MIVNVSIVGDKALIARLNKMPQAVRSALRLKIQVLLLKLEKLVKTGKLNGQVLNRITGNLARSISNKLEEDTKSVMGKVFSSGDVKYARIHEYGGKTPPHIIEPKKAQFLAWKSGAQMDFFRKGGGEMVFAKKVNHPGSKMPERSFLRSSLRDMSSEISKEMKAAVIGAIQKQVHG